MRVVLTAANGFIGRHCLVPLLERGYEVCAVSSRPQVARDVDWRQVDLLNVSDVSTLMAAVRPTHLLHMAWVTTPGHYWTSPENLKWVAGSLHLLHEFRKNGGTRVVMAGSCAEYDWISGLCSEASTPLAPATLYGSCKHALQLVLEAFARETALSSAWGRIFFTYGPHEHRARLVPSIITPLLTGQPVECSDGLQARDFLFVQDVADAFVALLATNVSGAVNIASGRTVRIRDIALQLADRLGGHELIKFGARPSPRGEPPILAADVGRLRTEVGWTPRFPLDEGLDLSIRWWTQQLSGAVRSGLSG